MFWHNPYANRGFAQCFELLFLQYCSLLVLPSEISVSQGNYFTKITVSSLLQQLLNFLEGVVVMVGGWRCQW